MKQGEILLLAMIANPPENRKIRTETLQMFFVAFLILTAITTLIFRSFYSYQVNDYRRNLMLQEKQSILLQDQLLRKEFQMLRSDIEFISAPAILRPALRTLARGGSGADLLSNLQTFLSVKGFYDQVRLFDSSGRDLFCEEVDSSGRLIRCREHDRRSSELDMLVSRALQSEDDHFFISGMVLEKKNQILLTPFRPVMYICRPVFDESGRIMGVIEIRYKADKLTQYFAVTEKLGDAHHFLLDEDGYFLYSRLESARWGFAVPGREKESFMRDNPEEWGYVQAVPLYQTANLNGIFTSYRVNVSLNPTDPDIADSQADVGGLRWYIVNHVPQERIYLLNANLARRLLTIAIIFILIMVFPAWMVARSLASKKHDRDQLFHHANFDTLTNLPNRSLFYDRLDLVMKNARRYKHTLALMYLDLDGFKDVNDSLGHDAGDYVLQQTAFRLLGAVRESDTVARMGGDEFTIILSQIRAADDAKAVAANILEKFQEKFTFNGRDVHVGISMGIATSSGEKERDVLLNDADSAMYQAKNSGKNTFVLAE